MTGLSINKLIYDILINDKELNKIVSNKIYPLLADEATTFPFIIFRRNSIDTEYTKDGRVYDVCSVSIAVASTTYEQNIRISERVRELIELRRSEHINYSILSSVNEDYLEDTYITELVFRITLK